MLSTTPTQREGQRKATISVAVSGAERQWFKMQINSRGLKVSDAVRGIVADLSRMPLKSYLISSRRLFSGSPKISTKCSPELLEKFYKAAPKGMGLSEAVREELLRRFGEPPILGEEDEAEDSEDVFCPRCGPPRIMLPRAERGDLFCCNCRYTAIRETK
jgi:ribosomal protein S27AE